MKKNLFLFCFAAFIIISKNSSAQVPLRGYLSIGASAYLGDLVQGAPVLKQSSPAVTAGLSADMTQRFRVRANFSLLGAKGDDKLNKSVTYSARNLNFKTNIQEFALLGEYDMVNEKNHAIIPYVFFGPGVYHFNPTTIDRHGVEVNLHDYGTEGQYLGIPAYADRQYHLTQFNLQLGGGARYKLSEAVTLGVELSFRKLFTDYLDDVSTGYPSQSEFLAAGQVEASELSFRSDEIGHENTDVKNYPRGNPNRKDMYYTFQLHGTIRINNSYFNQ